jgi:Flp pilus assembly protein TadG
MRFKQRGAAAVEFALLLPLLLLVVDGVLEFSMVMYDKVILTHAAREAVRAGSLIQTPKLTSAEIAEIAQTYCDNSMLSFGVISPVVVVNQSVDPVYQTPLTVTLTYTYRSLILGGILTAIHMPIVMTSSATHWHE